MVAEVPERSYKIVCSQHIMGLTQLIPILLTQVEYVRTLPRASSVMLDLREF
jgi:hypothetical protein